MPAERRTLLRITRGLPRLCTTRAPMGAVHGLFDRLCRTATVPAKLAGLRKMDNCARMVPTPA